MTNSAGILLYRKTTDGPGFFLVHPGGPFWKNKDEGAWSIPKGEVEVGEGMLTAAIREFKEETGIDCSGEFSELEPVKLRSGKIVHAFALLMDADPAKIVSNNFSLEWPPRSGKFIEVPEIDRAGWFNFEEAKRKINPGQVPLIEQTANIINDKRTEE